MASKYTALVEAKLASGFAGKIQGELDKQKFTIKIDGLNQKSGNVAASVQKSLNQVSTAAKQASKDTEELNKKLTQTKSVTLSNNIQAWMNKNSKAAREFGTQLQQMKKDLNTGNVSSSQYRQLAADFQKIKSEAKAAGSMLGDFGRKAKSAAASVKDIALQAAGLATAYQVATKTINVIKEGFNTVVDLDTALVDLRKTTTMSGSDLAQFYRDANKEAKNLGVTTQEIISQAAQWSRLGYGSKADATTMARLSSQFAAISPGMSVDEATDSLVSTMKAFGFTTDQVLDGIMSKINILGNNFALSNSDLAAALQVSSSSMKAANNSFEQTLALITAGTEITQDASRVGNGLRTISMRIRGLDEETGEFDETLGNVKNDISELTHGKVSIMEDENTYKSTYEILKRISEIWDELSDKEQAGLLEKLFGKTRAQIGAAILSNFDAAEDAMTKMEQSAGNADKEMSIIMDSIDFKLNALKETATGMWQAILDRDAIKGGVDFLTKALGVIADLVDKIGLLPTILGGAGIVSLIKAIPMLFGAGSAASGIGKLIALLTGSAAPALLGVAAAITAITVGIKAWKDAHPTLQQLKDDAEKSQQEFDSMQKKVEETTSRIEELNKLKNEGTITEAQERELENLQTQLDMYQQQLDLLKYINDEKQKAVVQKANEEVDTFFRTQRQSEATAVGLYGEEYGVQRATTGYGGLLNKLDDYKDTAKTIADLEHQIAEFTASGDERSLEKAEKLNKQLTDAREKSVGQLDDILGIQKELMGYRENLVGKNDEDSIRNLQLIDETIALISKEAKQANPTIKTFAENFKQLPEDIQKAFKGLNVDKLTEEQLDAVIKWMDECGYSIDDLKAHFEDLNNTASESFTQTVQKNIGDLISFRDELAATSQALADYNKAMEGGEKGDSIASMQEIYKGAMEDLNAGKLDTNRLHAAASLFFSPEQLAAMNYDMAEIGKQLQSSMMKSLFDPTGESAQTAGQRMVQYIKDNAAKFHDVAGVVDQGNGKVSLWYQSIEKLAQAFGVSEAAMAAFLDEWDAYGTQVMRSSEETVELINRLSDLKTKLGDEKSAVKELISQMQAEGSDNIEIMNILNELRNSGAVTASVGELSQMLAETNQQVDELDTNEANPVINANDKASAIIDQVQSKLRSLNGQSATVNINANNNTGSASSGSSGSSGSSSKSSGLSGILGRIFGSRASGGRGPGGYTLLNEEGPELVSDKGVAYIPNGGKPGFAYLTKDAIVFNANQTKDILGSGRSLPSNAFASGNVGGDLISRLLSGRKTPAKRQAEGLTASTSKTSSKKTVTVSVKRCPRCGSSVASGLQTCPYCGYNFAGGGYSTSGTKTYTTTVNNNTGRITSSSVVSWGQVSDLAARINAATYGSQNAGVNRSALGSPTAVYTGQNMGGTGTYTDWRPTVNGQPNANWGNTYIATGNAGNQTIKSIYDSSTSGPGYTWKCPRCGRSNSGSTSRCVNCNYPGVDSRSLSSLQSGSLSGGGFTNGGGSSGGFSGSDDGGYAGTGGSVGGSDWQSASDPQKVDWIAVKLNRIQRIISDIQKVATSGFKKLSTRLSSTRSAISKITEEIETQESAYTRYMQEAESISLSDDLKKLVQDGTIDIRKYDEDTIDLINQYTEWYEKALESQSSLEDLRQSIADAYVSNFNNVQKDFENQLSVVEHDVAMLNKDISMADSMGYLANAEQHQALMDTQRKDLEVLYQELHGLEAYMKEAMDSGYIDEQSEAWYDMNQQILSVKEAIADANIEMVNLRKTIRSIKWNNFDYALDRFGKMNEEAQFLIDLMSHSKLFDDNGQFNNKGTTSVGLIALNYNSDMAEADAYAKELLSVQKELEENPYDTEVIARRETLLNLQRQSILAAESEKEAMKDLVSQGIQAQLSAMKDLIDAYDKSLDSAKDLYDYQKKVSEQSEDIATIQKQLSAYMGDTSEETRAKVQKLGEDLKKAQENLSDTEREQSIQEQRKMLSDLYDEYEELMNNRLDNIDVLMREMIDYTNENLMDIRQTVKDVSRAVGYTPTNELMNGVSSNMANYDRVFEGISSANVVLNHIYENVNAMARAAGAVKSFATGGMVDYNGLAIVHGASNNEMMLNAADTQRYLQASKIMRSIPMLNASRAKNLNLPGIGGGAGTVVDVGGVTVAIDHVQDYEDMLKQMRDDPKFEKLIEIITLDRAVGKSGFRKNMINF